MKLLSWNVRDLNSLRKHHMLRKRINQEKPTIVLLQETKCDKETMTTLAKKCWKESKVKASDSHGILWEFGSPLEPISGHLREFCGRPQSPLS
jgi:exonuclease III